MSGKKSNPFRRMFLSLKNWFSSGAQRRVDEENMRSVIESLNPEAKSILQRFGASGAGKAWLSERDPIVVELRDKKVVVQTSDFLTAKPGGEPGDRGYYYRINPRYAKLVRRSEST